MPTYTYRCENGHEHDRINIQANDRKPKTCPECTKDAARVFGLPQKAIVKGGTRTFHSRG